MSEATPIRAVTVDGYGTLLRLADPVERLQAALRRAGFETDAETTARAFEAEVHHYRPRAVRGRDPASLAALREECVGVFLRAVGAPLAAPEFVEPFMAALEFDPVAGAREALLELRELGLKLACAANWDIGLHAELDRLELSGLFELVLTSAEVGAPKPAPVIFERVLATLGVEPAAAVHIGDEELDRRGAHAAGMRFEPVPLSTLPARLAPVLAP